MTRFIQPSVILTALLSFALPAQAQNGSLTRSFVSSTGVDTNACTITAPCATFAHAYTKISANGIIAALDPGKYGPLAIIGPVTVNGNGWAAITAPAAGAGITINANPGDSIDLIGLEIDGAGAAYEGIIQNVGARLTVTNCTIQNFILNNSDPQSGSGIVVQPTSGIVYVTITDTAFSSNATGGFLYNPLSGNATVNGVIDRVNASNNGGDGIVINPLSQSGGRATFTITNSVTSNNGGSGIYVDSATIETRVTIDNVTVASNFSNGIFAAGNPNILLGRSVITNNVLGINNITSPNNFYDYPNNEIDFNDSDINGAILSKSLR
jgi:hypothetical protein